ncbi:CCA tRNA nucleotidyltransferase [Alterileibacterium massiliense]|uniref:CCA tRNA nucleotidyltransferase n=1 Tax=Alterileibacterium massiliense TaxID=1870997 RepID=UPI0008DA46F8|nr:hypothetical protein [Alterileibacterium massiliense]
MNTIPRKIISIIETIENEGFSAYIVGGSVRDLILGIEPNDWDIATNGTPDEIEGIFGKLEDYRIKTLGKKHGTITLFESDNSRTALSEITTFRIDGRYSDARHPDSVKFSSSLSEDLRRRDFTINALAMDKNGKIIDPLMGLKDIEERIIKAVGDPAARFNEDALRILRGIRFEGELAEYDFLMDKKTEEMMLSCKKLLSKISKERIQAEFNKILISRGASFVLRKYQEIIEFIIGFSYQDNLNLIGAINPANKELGNNNSANKKLGNNNLITKTKVLKINLAILMCKVPENKINEILKGLKYSKEIIKDVIFLISNKDEKLLINEIYARKMLQKMGEDRLNMLIEFKKYYISAEMGFINEELDKEGLDKEELDNEELEKKEIKNEEKEETYKKEIEKIAEFKKLVKKQIDEGACINGDMLEVDGNDIIKLRVKEGPIVGKALDFALEEIIEGKISNDREAIIHCIKDFLMVYLD